MSEVILALMFALTGCDMQPKAPYCRHLREAPVLAELVVEIFQEDAELATRIMFRESGFHIDARSSVGSVGYMGLNPKGVATFVCPKLDLLGNTRHHFECAKRIMNYYRKRCGTNDPNKWLSVYAGYPKCRPSPYSQKVLGFSPLPQKRRRSLRLSQRFPPSTPPQNYVAPTTWVPAAERFPFEVRQPCLGMPSPLAELRPPQ